MGRRIALRRLPLRRKKPRSPTPRPKHRERQDVVVRRRLVVTLAVFITALAVLPVVWFQATRPPVSEVVGDSPTRDGFKTVQYEGVRVDVPSSWERMDLSDCDFDGLEQWAPPDVPPCFCTEGMGFYASATFDSALGPGVSRFTEQGVRTWAGRRTDGNWTVSALSDRAVVREVLASVRGAG